jgi:phosphopantothenoylcysteine synthetase/decarboxylase
MRCIVTCGPSWEPIDRVRRLTNFSTGNLGLVVAEALAHAGWEVLCLKGEMASAHREPPGVELGSFSTNEDLLGKLEAQAGRAEAILQAAALCDYRVKSVRDAHGVAVEAAKIPTRAGGVTLELEPAEKVLPKLRALFPKSRLVGWKYEMDGTGDDALERARRQVAECGTDACVVNGAAWGEGFGFLEPPHAAVPLADSAALAAHVVAWLNRIE